MNRIALPALAAALLLGPVAGAAQVDARFRVTPQVALMTPADWFFYEVTGLGGSSPLVWTESSVLRSTALGLTAEAEIGQSGIWIRGNLLRTLDAETYLAHAVLQEAFPNPPSVRRTRYWLPTTMTLGSIELAFPTRFRLPFSVQPYVSAGIGGKHYSFDRSPLSEALAGIVQPEDGTVLMGVVGAGVVIPIRGIGLDLQIRDSMNKYWEDLQHDVLWSIGLAWEP